MTTEELEKLLSEATPAMDGLKRISADEWYVDMPCDGAWTFVGREDGSPRIVVIERGWGPTADKRQNAVGALCIAAPDLARKVIAAEKLVEALQVARDNEDIEGMFFALAAWEAAQ